MKKCLASILASAMLLCLAACAAGSQEPANLDTAPPATEFHDETGYTVTDPLPYPNYTFDGEPTTDELRQTAVQAMHDALSIRWSTTKTISYHKTGPVSNKLFQHEPDVTYAGVLYSSASSGLFQFLEFYNHDTGRLEFNGSSDDLKLLVGSSCADTVLWAWSTVSNSFTDTYHPVSMVYKNGYFPVGDYTYDFSAVSYTFLPTQNIVKQNGTDVIVDAYCQVLPADALVSTPDNHAMMAIEPAHVVYNSDGSINMEKSYIKIQDQRGGQGAGFYEHEEGGETILYSGRPEYNFTFKNLLEKSYIPVTTAEFMGEKAYEKATVTCGTDTCTTLEELLALKVESNYPLAVLNAILVYPDGGEVLIERTMFRGAMRGGVPRSYELRELSVLASGAFMADFKESNEYKVKIEVVTSTGERFVPVTLTIRK